VGIKPEVSDRLLPILNIKNENASPNYSHAYLRYHSNSPQKNQNTHSSSSLSGKGSLQSKYQNNASKLKIFESISNAKTKSNQNMHQR
jgi:hypothetical protein